MALDRYVINLVYQKKNVDGYCLTNEIIANPDEQLVLI